MGYSSRARSMLVASSCALLLSSSFAARADDPIRCDVGGGFKELAE